MKKLNKKDFLQISFMIFGMFFGAGNLIFPPLIGKESGVYFYLSILGFSLSAVLIPIIGVIEVSKFGDIENILEKIGKKFSIVFLSMLYITIAPLVAVPRAASTSYSIIFENVGDKIMIRVIYSIVFFSIIYMLCLTPNHLVTKLGKYLTPVLFTLILIIFLGTIIKGVSSFTPPLEKYSKLPLLQGFLDGYSTLDALTAVLFGVILQMNLRYKGIEDDRSIRKYIVKSSILAGIALFSIYSMIAFLGSSTARMFPNTKNGADILSEITYYVFGKFGFVLLAVVFTIACSSICISLLTCISEFYYKKNSKISYYKWLLLWTVVSTIVSIFGLNNILSFTIPLLLLMNPITIWIIFLTLTDKIFDGDILVYRYTTYVVCSFSLLSILPKLGLNLEVINIILSYIPFSKYEFAWFIPTFTLYILLIIRKRLYFIKK